MHIYLESKEFFLIRCSICKQPTIKTLQHCVHCATNIKHTYKSFLSVLMSEPYMLQLHSWVYGVQNLLQQVDVADQVEVDESKICRTNIKYVLCRQFYTWKPRLTRFSVDILINKSYIDCFGKLIHIKTIIALIQDAKEKN